MKFEVEFFLWLRLGPGQAQVWFGVIRQDRYEKWIIATPPVGFIIFEIGDKYAIFHIELGGP